LCRGYCRCAAGRCGCGRERAVRRIGRFCHKRRAGDSPPYRNGLLPQVEDLAALKADSHLSSYPLQNLQCAPQDAAALLAYRG
jgi:hypothetical protein